MRISNAKEFGDMIGKALMIAQLLGINVEMIERGS